MNFINQVDLHHITNLNADQLTRVLHVLLYLEGKSLPGFDPSVPFNITTGDGGSDGRATWMGMPAATERLPNRFTIFQNKATDLGPTKCYEEILQPKKKDKIRKLKGQLEKLVKENGAYVLFTNVAVVDEGKENRIQQFRKAIIDAGFSQGATMIIRVYDANIIKDWVNNYLTAVTLVQQFNGVTRPAGFISWEEWGNEMNFSSTSYQTNEVTTHNMTSIRDAIKTEKVIRICGHSGLGKSRLIFETFRPAAGEMPLVTDMIYYDVGFAADSSLIAGYIKSHRSDQQGTIVIDNCDAETHFNLSRLVKNTGNLRIITIGFDDRSSIQDIKVRLDRNNQRDIVSEIVEEKLKGSHNENDRDYIARLSEGYPWMAVTFCDAVREKKMYNLSQSPLDKFIRNLLFGSEGNDLIEYNVVSACSVFSSFGFVDDSLAGLINPGVASDLKEQMNFIREKIYDGTLADSRFREICQKFRNLDIIEKRGTLYIVKPTILAINLAAHWLTITDPERIKTIIESLRNKPLEEKFIDRLTDLDQLDKARDLVSELWGPTGFFGSAEALSSAWGSLLFRYVVEVNPADTVRALVEAFFDRSVEELRKLTEPRRNLVWALEKLVFREVSFDPAAKMLYKFAVAENETWSNNATQQFIQLFQIYLPGTEVNFSRRLEVIRWGLKQKQEEFIPVAISALGQGLLYDRFFRSGGAENQGSSAPLKDYEPQTWAEVFEYWKNILDLLVPLAVKSEYSGMAERALVQALRSMVAHGGFDLINKALRSVMAHKQAFWPEALEALRITQRYEGHVSEADKNGMIDLATLLTPTDVSTTLAVRVSRTSGTDIDEEDFSGEKAAASARQLAEEFVSKKVDLIPYLPQLLQAQQQQGFNFGHRLAELNSDPNTLANQMLEALKSIPRDVQNPEVLMGFVRGAGDSSLTNRLYETLLSHEEVAHHGFQFARVNQLSIEQIMKLFDMIDRFGFSVTLFSTFQYGRASARFTPEELIHLCRKLTEHGLTGRWISVSILFMYCHGNQDNWLQCRGFLKETIAQVNMCMSDGRVQSMEAYHWCEIVSRDLEEEHDPVFASTIINQLVEMYSGEISLHRMEPYITKVLRILIENYFEQTWRVVGAALLKPNYIFVLNARTAFGNKNGYRGHDGILFLNPAIYDDLFAWCETSKPIAPRRIANMMPLADRSAAHVRWHPFSRRIIDQFGNDEKMLAEVSANMGTYGSVGSRQQYLETLRDLMGELTDHPIETVRQWATEHKHSFEKAIRLDQLSDEEQQF